MLWNFFGGNFDDEGFCLPPFLNGGGGLNDSPNEEISQLISFWCQCHWCLISKWSINDTDNHPRHLLCFWIPQLILATELAPAKMNLRRGTTLYSFSTSFLLFKNVLLQEQVFSSKGNNFTQIQSCFLESAVYSRCPMKICIFLSNISSKVTKTLLSLSTNQHCKIQRLYLNSMYELCIGFL